MPQTHHVSAAVRRTLRKLGSDIRDARRRRRLPAAIVARRAFTSRPALRRVESGDPSVSIGIYAAALQALGLADRLGDLADPTHDTTGAALEAQRLPKRVHLRRPSDDHHA